jgi:DNA-binding MarR family transcriptional regulator
MNKSIARDDCNCFALRQAARYVTQIYERHLAEVGLTAAQFTILSKLSRQPDRTMADLSESMVMERTTLVRALKPLQRDGLITAKSAEHDARAQVFRLSESGEKIWEQAVIAWSNAQQEFEAKTGAAKAKALRAELFNLTGVAQIA